jgi:hypothetical protein
MAHMATLAGQPAVITLTRPATSQSRIVILLLPRLYAQSPQWKASTRPIGAGRIVFGHSKRLRVVEITCRYVPRDVPLNPRMDDADAAQARLEAGNRSNMLILGARNGP